MHDENRLLKPVLSPTVVGGRRIQGILSQTESLSRKGGHPIHKKLYFTVTRMLSENWINISLRGLPTKFKNLVPTLVKTKNTNISVILLLANKKKIVQYERYLLHLVPLGVANSAESLNSVDLFDQNVKDMTS